ncbi:eecb4810-a8a2-432a-9e4d-d3e0f89d93ce [Thermothielavioides terrestris]|uniref:Eecb4810-a8a2-432a-9e4d-d3e0f89d93ce n=1 Tax=Thermothielavioides terrestris TaxID=2587410 RepID=A0A446BIZ4_9PEZI|nr:eecb4810-a8a2-432a-9e4d-d3e0f89d93ce [Thermothielavioides terrestris]
MPTRTHSARYVPGLKPRLKLQQFAASKARKAGTCCNCARHFGSWSRVANDPYRAAYISPLGMTSRVWRRDGKTVPLKRNAVVF